MFIRCINHIKEDVFSNCVESNCIFG
uniref:Uncharacterized protein n=1 Tax=Anguilla anguilla TaxID=7936 RepID=A0A0E9UAT5_ANGAN